MIENGGNQTTKKCKNMRRQPPSSSPNSSKPQQQSTSANVQQQSNNIVPNVAVSETSRQHPFFLQGKDEPILSESLPPKVRGQCLGEIFLCLHCIKWITNNNNNNFAIHPIWWGSDDRSVSLIPPSNESNSKEDKSKISVRYPVKTTEDIFRIYLSSM